MRLPRDISGAELAQALGVLGYVVTRQHGSHMRMTTQRNGEHHITVPAHDPMKIGTLNSILREVAAHHGVSRDELVRRIF